MIKFILTVGVLFYCVETVLLFVSTAQKSRFPYWIPTIHGILFWIMLSMKYLVIVPDKYISMIPLPEEITEFMVNFGINEMDTELMFLWILLAAVVSGALVRVLAGYYIFGFYHVFAIQGLVFFARRMGSAYEDKYVLLGSIALVVWGMMAITSKVRNTIRRNKMTERNESFTRVPIQTPRRVGKIQRREEPTTVPYCVNEEGEQI